MGFLVLTKNLRYIIPETVIPTVPGWSPDRVFLHHPLPHHLQILVSLLQLSGPDREEVDRFHCIERWHEVRGFGEVERE